MDTETVDRQRQRSRQRQIDRFINHDQSRCIINCFCCIIIWSHGRIKLIGRNMCPPSTAQICRSVATPSIRLFCFCLSRLHDPCLLPSLRVPQADAKVEDWCSELGTCSSSVNAQQECRKDGPEAGIAGWQENCQVQHFGPLKDHGPNRAACQLDCIFLRICVS